MTPVTDPRKLTSSIDLPRHVGIIMDGNGRWASARSLPRFEGHRRGVEAVRRAVRAAGDLGIGYLSLYAFSSENWSRPPQEVDDLMGLLKRFIRIDLADLHKQNVRVRIIGSRMDLASELDELLDEAEAMTRDNTGLTVVIAFNYAFDEALRQYGQRERRFGGLASAPAQAMTGS